MLIDEVIARLDAPEGVIPFEGENILRGRIAGAAELSRLVTTGSLPPTMPAAYVFPQGERGGDAEAATGIFRQAIVETVSVVLIAEAAGDVTAAIALPTIEALKVFTRTRIAGWAPADAIGVFKLARGQMLQVGKGVVVYQLDFSVDDQMRIA